MLGAVHLGIFGGKQRTGFVTYQELNQSNTTSKILSKVIDMRNSSNVQLVVHPLKIPYGQIALFRIIAQLLAYHFVKAIKRRGGNEKVSSHIKMVSCQGCSNLDIV
jgi:hypothetical protein